MSDGNKAQVRHWCFTINNPTPETTPSFDDATVRYAIYQTESGANGTPHLQGYVEFKRSMRLQAVRKLLPGAHLEPRRGTREQARDYCRKDEGRLSDPIEFGEFGTGGAGKRNDVANLKRLLDDGATDLEIWNECPVEFLRFQNGIKNVRRLLTPPRTGAVTCEVHVGTSGCGKTRYAMEHFPPPDAYWKSPSTGGSDWWDDYEGQHTVVMDDFYGWVPFSNLLRLIDRYPLTVQTKGSHVSMTATHFVLTSNKFPGNWYSYEVMERYDMSALFRRITKLVHYVTADVIHVYETQTDISMKINSMYVPKPSENKNHNF